MDRLDDRILDLINVESWQGTWGDGPPTREETDPAKVAEIKEYLQEIREGRQALERLGARHVSDLLSETSPRQWTWERVLPVGTLSLIAGPPKAGKSTLTYQLAVSVARGQPFVGLQTRRTPVLIISAEESEQDIKLRLRSYGVTAQDEIRVIRRKSSDYVLQELRGALRGYRRIGGMFVLVDSFSKFTGIEDENSPEAGVAATPFSEMAHEYGSTIHFIHHTRKAGGHGGNEIRGHSSLLQTVDTALVFSRGNRLTERKIITYSRYADETLHLDYQDGWYIRAETEPDVQDAKIEEACKEPRTIEEASSLTGLDEGTVRYALEHRLSEKVPRVSGKGRKGDPYRYQTVQECVVEGTFDWAQGRNREDLIKEANERPSKRKK